jgi:hypothetical protein
MACTVKMVINGENRSIPKPDAFSNMNILDLKFSQIPTSFAIFWGEYNKNKIWNTHHERRSFSKRKTIDFHIDFVYY